MDKRVDFIFRRRSIRQFLAKPVAEKDIGTLLEAGMAAPSASNLKPWHFIAVTERKTLNALADAHPYGKMLAQATLAIAVCGDPSVSERYWDQDGAAATENILLAAPALGLGAVWIGIHPHPSHPQAVARLLGMPEHVLPFCLVYVGYAAENKPPRTHYDEKRVYWDRYEPRKRARPKNLKYKG